MTFICNIAGVANPMHDGKLEGGSATTAEVWFVRATQVFDDVDADGSGNIRQMRVDFFK